MGDTILEINHLSKNYKDIKAISDLSLKIESQMVYGLLGPNGSGKTTTLGILLGVIRQSKGSFSWFGEGEKDENRKRIGALLETPNFYPYLSAQENLELVAKIKGIDLNPENLDSNSKSIDDVLELVGLTERRKSKFRTFSLGMKQRLAIGAALLGDPQVLVLDEPTNGLDPQGIAEIRDLIIEIGKSGRTIIIASHILDEIEKVCTHCAILRKGELLQTGTISDIIGNQDATLIKLTSNDIKALKTAINQMDKVSIYKEDEGAIIIRTESGTKTSDVNQMFFDKGIVLSALNMFNESLENQFLEIVGKS
ncbi:MAG: ATP-binding cassette domain-containing protein [Crocinitomicaceae bacterium]|nr:ATP-binding cassette domain-containing protein [Crocinitomicaceae bacterium]